MSKQKKKTTEAAVREIRRHTRRLGRADGQNRCKLRRPGEPSSNVDDLTRREPLARLVLKPMESIWRNRK
jgi:hypothetical protein